MDINLYYDRGGLGAKDLGLGWALGGFFFFFFAVWGEHLRGGAFVPDGARKRVEGGKGTKSQTTAKAGV